ncbi:hypothetical protein [Mycobacteroides abscessus]|uniref:hypothetical protein n=1 Tax=Mycobacteroides abscessus TaxID=36809 RepID=UPI002107C205|nr:hypothetical protein [Mycobacteroides abscessus]
MDTGFGTWQLHTACKVTFTHLYEPGGTCSETVGTGFLTQFPTGDPRLAIVTNRHLTDIGWAQPARVGAVAKAVEIEFWASEKFRLTYKTENVAPLYHEDDSIDVSVVPVGPMFETEATVVALYDSIDKLVPDPNFPGIMFNHAMSWNYLLKCERLWPELKPGEFVVFPGYPKWFDKLESRPVFRSGMIASDPQRDYRQNKGETTHLDGNQQVLFDAFSTSGNSGSPVFVAQQGLPPLDLQMKLDQQGSAPAQAAKLEFKPYHESFLIGINAGHFNDTDSERPNDHAGLSRFHKLSAIMEILRANASPSDVSAPPALAFRVPVEMVEAQGGLPQSYLDAIGAEQPSPEAGPEPATAP